MVTLYDFLESYFDGEVPPRDWKKALLQNRQKIGDEEFVQKMIYWTGGRSFNLFLDFGLVALKIKALEEELSLWTLVNEKTGFPLIRSIVEEYLWDDRHDIYQNVPYYLDEIKKQIGKEEWQKFVKRFAEILLECFNPSGTGDVSKRHGYEFTV